MQNFAAFFNILFNHALKHGYTKKFPNSQMQTQYTPSWKIKYSNG